MRTSAVLLLALLAGAALPASAPGKEVSRVQVCGASGCFALPAGVAHSGAFMEGGLPADPPRRARDWYVIRTTISASPGEDMERFTYRNVYVPGAGRVRERGEGGGFDWYEPAAGFAAAVRPYLRRVEPFPAARLRGLEPAAPAAVAPARHGAAAADGGGVPVVVLIAAGALVALGGALAIGRARKSPERPHLGGMAS